MRLHQLAARMTALVASLATAAACHGFGGVGVRTPTPTAASATNAPAYSARTGLALEVDTRWFDAGGYRPVLLTVDSASAFAEDRVVDVEISLAEPSNRGLSGDPSMVVSGRVVLPAGQTKASATLLCPGLSDWRFAWWSVTVDGEPDPRLSVPRGGAIPIGVNPQEVMLRKLNPRTEKAGMPFQSRSGSVKVFRRMSGPTLDDVVAPYQDDWLAYTATDIISLNLSELEALAESSSTELTALRRWVLAGGTLWIERSGASNSRLEKIDRLLGIGNWRFQATDAERDPDPPVKPQGKRNEPAEEPEGSTDPVDAPLTDKAPETSRDSPDKTAEEDAPKLGRGRNRKTNPIEGFPGWGHALLGDDDDAEVLAKQLRSGDTNGVVRQLFTKAKDTSGWYAQRDLGFGRVIAFRRTALETPLALALGGVREATNQWAERGWGRRHGFAPTEPSPSFGNLLIPGVGVAPVNEFQVLITLFVLVIGPLNYWLLWRRQQLQLLVLTTPLCALAVTLGLFAYAAVADGFGVKARVRSLSLIDQTTEEAITWSRISHYAAMAPEETPSFPDDTALYPIRPVWESAIAPTPVSRHLDWRNSEQKLTSGWLPSRTTVQHLAVRCRETEAKLLIREAGSSREVSNQLGAPLELLLVRDTEGDWQRATSVEEGAVAPLESVPRSEALKDFRLTTLANQPEFPIGAGKAIEQTLERLGSGQNLRRMQRNLSLASLTDNLMNDLIGDFSGLSGGRGLDVPPRTYVAVTIQSVETPLGWDDVQEVGSFHVIVGRW